MTESALPISELTASAVAFGLRTDFQAFCQKVFRELLPGDVFRDNWHIDALCHEIMQTIEGKNQRLVVTIPPRSLKSLIISVALPAFVLGRDPSRRVVCISYSDELSAKMAADFRKVVNGSVVPASFSENGGQEEHRPRDHHHQERRALCHLRWRHFDRKRWQPLHHR